MSKIFINLWIEFLHNLVNCIVTLFPSLDTTVNTQLWLSWHTRFLFFIFYFFIFFFNSLIYEGFGVKVKILEKSTIVKGFDYIVYSHYFHQSFKFHFRDCSELATGMEYFGISVCQCTISGFRTKYIFKYINKIKLLLFIIIKLKFLNWFLQKKSLKNDYI